MATVTLRPDGIDVENGLWTAYNWPTAIAVGELADNNDSTYWQYNGGSTAAALLTLSTFSFPAGAQIRSVRPRLRSAQASGGYSGPVTVQLYDGLAGAPLAADTFTVNSTTISTFSGT